MTIKTIAELVAGDVVDLAPIVEHVNAQVEAKNPEYGDDKFTEADVALVTHEYATVEEVRAAGSNTVFLFTDLVNMAIRGDFNIEVAEDDQ